VRPEFLRFSDYRCRLVQSLLWHAATDLHHQAAKNRHRRSTKGPRHATDPADAPPARRAEADALLSAKRIDLNDPTRTSTEPQTQSAAVALIRVRWPEWDCGSQLRYFCESSPELRDQCRQGLRPLIRGEVTAAQPLDLEPELAQPFLREVDLPVLKGIFIAAAHQERELASVSLEEVTEVEPMVVVQTF
jgi:hypothetical protein